MNNFFKKHFISSGWLNTWRPYFVIFVLGLLLYHKTLFFDFTYFDDNILILYKTVILKNFLNIGQIFSSDVFLSVDKLFYRPFLNLSFMIDTNIAGCSSLFYHLMNILIHCLAACLVFKILKRLTERSSLSFFLSLLFLVHPVLTQAVAWIPGRNDSLLAVFILSAFIMFLNFRRKPLLFYYLAYLLFFLLALFTKESAVVFPLLIIYYFSFIDRGELKKSDKYLLIIGTVALIFIWYLMRFLALGGQEVNYFSAGQEIIHGWPAILFSLGKLTLPFNLSVLPVSADSPIIYGVISLIFLGASLYYAKEKRYNYLFFGLLWFFLFLLPSFIHPNGQQDFLEHRLYMPLFGFLIILAEIDFIKKLDFRRIAVKSVVFLLLILFSILTYKYENSFRNRLDFWEAAVKSSPHSITAHRNLGAIYYLERRLTEAEREYRYLLNLNDHEPAAHNNLGIVLKEQGRLTEAAVEFNKEAVLSPRYDQLITNY